MAIVIGKAGKKVKEKDAMSHVFGFTTAHDVSARDWQLKRNGGQWLIGKTMDHFCPLGIHIYWKSISKLFEFVTQKCQFSLSFFLYW